MTDATTVAAELPQAQADMLHLRLLVAERKVSAAALAVAEYRVMASAGVSPTTRNRPPATDHPPPTNRQPGGGGRLVTGRDAQDPRGSPISLPGEGRVT